MRNIIHVIDCNELYFNFKLYDANVMYGSIPYTYSKIFNKNVEEIEKDKFVLCFKSHPKTAEFVSSLRQKLGDRRFNFEIQIFESEISDIKGEMAQFMDTLPKEAEVSYLGTSKRCFSKLGNFARGYFIWFLGEINMNDYQPNRKMPNMIDFYDYHTHMSKLKNEVIYNGAE